MSGVREWATVICLAALSAAMLQSLMPNGSMERMAKFVIGAFIICALISPISQVAPHISTILRTEGRSTQENTMLNSTVNHQFEDAARQSITNLVQSELKQMGIFCKNVQVIMDTDADGSISISKVIVTLDREEASGRAGVSSTLEKTLGIQTEVVSDDG